MPISKPDKLRPTDWYMNVLMYGGISVLLVLERLEEDGFYEECQNLLGGINEVAEKTHSPYPTRMSKRFLKEVIGNFTAQTGHTITEENALRIYGAFAEEILRGIGYDTK